MTLVIAANAQVVNGDLNHSGKLDVSDLTHLINNYLTGTSETISGVVAPFGTDKSCIVGTWWKSPTERFTFNDDCTTDYRRDYTYEFLPQGYILFYDEKGTLTYLERIVNVTADSLFLMSIGSITPVAYSSKRPINITLSKTSFVLQPDDYKRITATVVPADAGTVTWSSSDENVALVMSGIILAIADGTTTITASVGDVSATCAVEVASTTIHNGHEYVDLGLSVKWATMNIGASSPEDYGDYFAWGETTPKKVYNWNTYKYGSTNLNMTKYNATDGKTILDLSDDAANVNWGGVWRMPTEFELYELATGCNWTWTTQNGVDGYKVVSKTNGKSIFLPAAGYCLDASQYNVGSYGNHWSSSLNTSNVTDGWYLYFLSSSFSMNYYGRYYGRNVRAVCP